MKFGGPTETCKQAIAKFPNGEQQSAATEACQHLSTAMDAYTYAKEYTGLSHYPGFPDVTSDKLDEKEYAGAKNRFPGLDELPVAETNSAGYKFYNRSAMVQALWATATQESEAARRAFGRLSQM